MCGAFPPLSPQTGQLHRRLMYVLLEWANYYLIASIESLTGKHSGLDSWGTTGETRLGNHLWRFAHSNITFVFYCIAGQVPILRFSWLAFHESQLWAYQIYFIQSDKRSLTDLLVWFGLLSNGSWSVDMCIQLIHAVYPYSIDILSERTHCSAASTFTVCGRYFKFSHPGSAWPYVVMEDVFGFNASEKSSILALCSLR